ncbi:hypothetical protein D3C79_962020 [compost metagenome]
MDRLRQRLRRTVGSNVELVFAQIAVAQRSIETPVDKHQPISIQVQRQRITLSGGDRLGLRLEELLLQQPFQRGIFPVFMLARRPAQAQSLLPVRQSMSGAFAASSLEQAVKLLQRARVIVGR